MTPIKKHQVILLIWGLLVFIGGFAFWLQAHCYQPQHPERKIPRHFSYQKKVKLFRSERYQSLLSGSLFFGQPYIETTIVFQSKLFLWGISGDGKNSRAVVGIDSNPGGQTQVVKIGTHYAEETIVSISQDHIVVRNQTGEGRVYLGNER